MHFKIHRGTNEIGGSCVEVWTDKAGIVIDLGLPLVNPDKSQFNSSILKDKSSDELIVMGVIPSIKGLETGEYEILISHAHQDHYGLLNYFSRRCIVHLGQATHEIIKLSGVFTPTEVQIPNHNYFESGKKFQVGDIEITPYLMDHSAFDAYAFLVEADGKSLFYSGDFRLHGRKRKSFDWFKHKFNMSVDYLLLEGTTIGNNSHQSVTETDLERQFLDTFKGTKGIHVVFTSGQNIDRLVTIFRACRKAGKKLVIDFYIASLLKKLKQYAKLPYPSKDFNEIKVFFPKFISDRAVKGGNANLLYQFKPFKYDKEAITKDCDNVVIILRPSMFKFVQTAIDTGKGTIIYSMWKGYLKDKKTADFVQKFKDSGFNYKYIHTSGHADLIALVEMVETVNPKHIVPIHTFAKSSYKDQFRNRAVQIIEDGVTITV